MARSPTARSSADRIFGKMRRLGVHSTTVYLYALTLTDPPLQLAHLKGICRIGQTADHRGQGRVATLANRFRQYKQLRGKDIVKEIVEEIAAIIISASATSTASVMNPASEWKQAVAVAWLCFSELEVLETIWEPSVTILQSLMMATADWPRCKAHAQANVREKALIAEKGTWRGRDAVRPLEQRLNDQAGGQGDELERIRSQVLAEEWREVRKTRYICDHAGCNKSFTTSSVLKRHKRRHTGDRPFACDYEGCSFRSTTSGDLKVHKRWHTGDRPFACDYEGCSNGST